MLALLVLAVVFVLTAATTALAWRRRAHNRTSILGLVVLQLGGLVWVASDVLLALLAPGAAAFLPLSVLRYLGVGASTAGYVVLALSLSGAGWAPRTRTWLLLAAEPVVAAVLIVVPAWRHLFFVPPDVVGPYGAAGWRLGPFFTVHLLWVNGAVLWSATVLLVRTLRMHPSLRLAGLLVAAAALPPVLVLIPVRTEIATVVPGSDVPMIDVGMVLGGLICVLAVAWTNLTATPTFVRSLVVEEMPDALVALTQSGLVADLNTAGRRLAEQLSGGPVAVGEAAPTALRDVVAGDGRATTTVRLPGEDGSRELDVRVSVIVDRAGNALGRALVARDVTEINRASTELAARLREIEELQEQVARQATHDELTGLPNRRYLRSALTEATRDRYALVVADLDDFKSVNDRWGHQAGDTVLRHAARVMRRVTGPRAVVGRWGGEEFLVVVPTAGIELAYGIAEAVRAAAAAEPATVDGRTVPWTVSLGVAGAHAGDDPDETLAAADRALYLAKSGGRNRVVIARAPGTEPAPTTT